MAALAAAEAVANNDRAPKTINGYNSKLNKIREWVREMTEEGADDWEWDEDVMSNPPLPDNLVKAFMGKQSQPKDDGSVNVSSTVRGFVSALKWWYSTESVFMSDELNQWLSRFNKGHKRKIAELKQNGEMDQHEGKVGFSFTAYVYMASRLLKEYAADTAYAHAFFVLGWNLIARSVVVSEMRYEFMWLDNDMIVALPPKQKADQAGERLVGKHICANPFRPEICALLALARLVFSDGDRAEYTTLFPRAAYDGFGDAFHDLVRTEDARDHLEVAPEKLGKHSTRKGGATYASSFPGGPGRDEICQRADWSLGGVRDRYIAPVNNGKDQFVARTMAGLDINSVDYSMLPPHWTFADTVEVTQRLRGLINVDAYPESFRGCLPLLLASLAYHIDFLDEHLDPQDRLRMCRAWTSGMQAVETISGFTFSCRLYLCIVLTMHRCLTTAQAEGCHRPFTLHIDGHDCNWSSTSCTASCGHSRPEGRAGCEDSRAA